MLLYQEFLRTEPWDFLLALAVIGVVAVIPVIVSLGLRIQERRSEEERPLPWLKVISREAGGEVAEATDAAPSGETAARRPPHRSA